MEQNNTVSENRDEDKVQEILNSRKQAEGCWRGGWEEGCGRRAVKEAARWTEPAGSTLARDETLNPTSETNKTPYVN